MHFSTSPHATERILMHVFSTSVVSVVSERESKMEGYAFEQEYTTEELEALEHKQNDSLRVQEQRREPDRRLTNLDWCSCSNFALMPTRKE